MDKNTNDDKLETQSNSSLNTSCSSASSIFTRDEQELTSAQRTIIKKLPKNRTLTDLLNTGFAFPFAPLLPKKDLLFYFHRFLQITIGPFLFLFRLIYGMTILISVTSIMKFLTRKVDLDKPINPLLRKVLYKLQVIGAWFITQTISFHYIKEEGIENKPDLNKAHVCVANHTNAFDPVILSTVGFTSYMAKADIKKFPFFGVFNTCSQGPFVDRSDKNSREKSLKDIEIRVADPMIDAPVGNGRRYPLLTIFPEGTTVNQHGLLPFKKGAFTPGKPVNPIVIKYNYRLNDPCDAVRGLMKTIVLFMWQIHTPITVKYLPEYRPSAEEIADPELYAQNVRILIAKELNVPMLPFSYRDKMHAINGLKFPERYPYEKCSSAFKEVFPVPGELNINSLSDLSIPSYNRKWKAEFNKLKEAINAEEAKKFKEEEEVTENDEIIFETTEKKEAVSIKIEPAIKPVEPAIESIAQED